MKMTTFLLVFGCPICSSIVFFLSGAKCSTPASDLISYAWARRHAPVISQLFWERSKEEGMKKG